MLLQRRWKPESAVLLGFGLFFCLGFGMLCSLVIQRVFPRLTEGDRLFAGLIVNTVSIHGAALLLVHLALRQNGFRWNDFLGVTSPDLPRSLGFALLVGVLSVPFALVLNKISFDLFRWFGHEPAEQAMIRILQQESTWGQRAFQALVAIGVAPVAEESIFRGILYPVIRQEGHPRFALWASSFIFAAIHVNLLTFVPLLVFGLILARLYERTGTLLAPMVTHSFFNLVNFVLLVFPVDLDRRSASGHERV